MVGRRALLAGLVLPLAPSPSRAAEPLEEVTVAISANSFVMGGFRIGQQAGLFAQHGLNPRVVIMDSGSAAMSALIGGSAQFSVNGPSETLTARSRGQDVVIVANLYAGMAASVVVGTAAAQRSGVAPGAPVEERLRVLDSLVMAVPSATSAPLGAIRAAAEALGVKLRLTYMAQGAMQAALEANVIQAMIAAFPFAGGPILRGTGVMWIDGPRGDLPAEVALTSSASLQTAGSFLASNRAAVRKMQHTLIAIADYIRAEPAAARQALAVSYPQLDPKGIDLAFDSQWRNWTKPFLTEPDIRQELKILIASTKAAGLDRMDPATILVGPQ